MTDLNPEKLEILDMIDQRRQFLLHTVAGLTDEQAASQPTVSELSLAGIIKHLTATEADWMNFIRHGVVGYAPDWGSVDWQGIEAGTAEAPEWLIESNKQWVLQEGETLADVVGAFNEQAAETRVVVSDCELDQRHELPAAPWFEPGQEWSNRQVLLNLLGEIAQHSGHADIIRETIDGQKTMG